MGKSPRFFQIGFKKCGTSAIAAFFNRSGIPCVHWDHGKLALTMRANMRAGNRILKGYEQYRAFTNMDYVAADDCFEGFRHYTRLLEDYPEAKFILNTRDREKWIRSMLAHGSMAGTSRVRFYEWKYGSSAPEKLAGIWRKEWDEHHSKVIDEVPADLLLVFDIESDPPERLCRFAGLPDAMAENYRIENPSLNRLGVMLVRYTPPILRRVLPHGARLAIKRRLGA